MQNHPPHQIWFWYAVYMVVGYIGCYIVGFSHNKDRSVMNLIVNINIAFILFQLIVAWFVFLIWLCIYHQKIFVAVAITMCGIMMIFYFWWL